jgi:tetratricopeptide (TPR) repeat protein
MTDEIRAELEHCASMPQGHAKAHRLEALADRARDASDPGLEALVLYHLGQAYEYSAEREKMPVAFGRLLQLLDRHSAEVGYLSREIHWLLKWMTTGLGINPAVQMTTINRWLEELDSRYQQAGYSPRPVLAFRSWLATQAGDHDAASTWMEQSIAAPRDGMSDCLACEHGDWGDWRAAAGDDEGALEHWAPVLGGTLSCAEEPHRTLAKALLPLLRTGRADEARSAFLRGYPLVRRTISLTAFVGQHIEFCALTGNEARGLEILAEHASWLADTQVDARARLGFLSGTCVLLGRLTELGHDDLPIGTSTVAGLLPAAREQAREIAGRYDARNGSTAASDRLEERLRQRPLRDSLPLGLPARLPGGTRLPVSTGLTLGTALGGEAGELAGVVSSPMLDDLVAQARRLTEARHPGAGRAWARVAASDADLPAEVAAAVTRSKAGELMRTDPGAARVLLLDAAGAFAELGDLDGELEALASAAVATQLAGQPQAAREAIRDVAARAEDAFTDGTLTDRHYLNVRVSAQMMLLRALELAAERDPADVDAVESGAAEVLAVAADLGQRYHVGRCHELLWRLAAMRGDRGAATEHLHGAREAFLAVDAPWFAAMPEAMLAESALQDGNGHAAERLARDALRRDAGTFPPGQVAQLWSLIVESLSRQQGREADLADAALSAAARWDGISEPDTVHSTFIAARAYSRLGRHGEASALFAQAMPKVEVPYEAAVVAMTRDQYGRSLRAIGRHKEAAEQFLEAALIVADDPANAGPHAMLAALAAEELRAAGELEAALPAFLRAGDLFGAIGDIMARARCLRSAAWLQHAKDEDSQDTGDQSPASVADPAAVALMRAVLAELEASEAPASTPVATEIEATRKQLAAMLDDS